MKVAFTGHRPHKLGNDYDLTGPLTVAIGAEFDKLITRYEPTHFYIGMALGVDTLAALHAIKYNIPFTAAVPIKDQEKMWPIHSQILYHRLLDKAAEVVIVSEGAYSAAKMMIRNMWMIDKLDQPGDMLWSVWDGSSGGTKNTIVYAGNKIPRIEMINIDPNVLRTKL